MWKELDKKTLLSINVEGDIIDLAHHPHEHMGSDYPLTESLKELDLTNCRLKQIENTQNCKNLQILCLRQNLITKMEHLDTCVALKHLDLYDNQITIIQGVDSLPLEHLDLSFNKIKQIENLPSGLKKLYLCQNEIIEMKGLEPLNDLVLLELGSNKITEIDYKMDSLEELWLGKNKISQIKGLSPNLTRLSLQDNLITKMEGLSLLSKLTELYLSENGIKKMEGLDVLTHLVILDVSNNKITIIENVEHLQEMEEFWCTDNKIEEFKNISCLSKCGELKSVYFQRNKIDQDVMYKRKLMLELVNVREIDGSPVMKK
jgi:protein phosphatase 1 regulatory subunit 7